MPDKRISQQLDSMPRTLFAPRDVASETVYPILVDNQGKLLVNTESSGNVSAATCSSVTIGAVSTAVLASRDDRIAAILVNDSDENIYVKYGSGATLNSGIRLNASGGSVVEDKYTGIITAICASGGKNLTVTEM